MMTVAGRIPIQMNSTPMKTMPGTVFRMDSRGSRYRDSRGSRDRPMPRDRPTAKPMATHTRV